VLDIPAGARGKYTVNLNTDETFACDDLVFCEGLNTLRESGFVVNIFTGQCCYGLGTPDEGCVDGVLRSECVDDEPGPVVFTPDERCPPDGPDCSRLLGACCDTLDGSCEDGTLQRDCGGALRVWSGATACSGAACVSQFGACCDTLHGSCWDSSRENDCGGVHRAWSRGTACIDVSCAADLGACCNHALFGSCTDDAALSDCGCTSCTWHKLQNCAEIECAQTSIPTTSEWGSAIMTLLLLTVAKVYFGQAPLTRNCPEAR